MQNACVKRWRHSIFSAFSSVQLSFDMELHSKFVCFFQKRKYVRAKHERDCFRAWNIDRFLVCLVFFFLVRECEKSCFGTDSGRWKEALAFTRQPHGVHLITYICYIFGAFLFFSLFPYTNTFFVPFC